MAFGVHKTPLRDFLVPSCLLKAREAGGEVASKVITPNHCKVSSTISTVTHHRQTNHQTSIPRPVSPLGQKTFQFSVPSFSNSFRVSFYIRVFVVSSYFQLFISFSVSRQFFLNCVLLLKQSSFQFSFPIYDVYSLLVPVYSIQAYA